MDSPRPRNWNQKLFATYLGGTDKEIHELRRVLTQLMTAHGKLDKGYKSKAARTELQEWIQSNLHRLPGFVQDACFNKTRMDGLMGMAYKIKNEHVHYLAARGRQIPAAEPPSSIDQGSSVVHGSQRVEQEDNHEVDQLPSSNPSNTVDQQVNAVDVAGAAVTVQEETVAEPASKRAKTTPTQAAPPQPSLPDLLSRNIWVLNEVDPSKHGLCSMQDLLTTPESRKIDFIPRLIDLDFDHWLSIVEAQCGYDFTAHRLEYRPPANVVSRSLGLPPITVPLSTQSQWRGAINSQIHAEGGRDPVFYLVSQSGEDVQNPSTPPLPSPSSANTASRARPPLVVKQEYVEEQLRLAGMQ
ncbi:hypothetical protein CDV55_107167 [Aspergillus turcosus]|uniref:Uncharacterized protein n=1 Tax=Aspergillus turcosus TaxID=1245748 RepID=A0A229Z321_9EURO|nr:hypothetical protein CDV55_107167 [Aspergillus turcosus]RLM01472.1 hypothetical protein CFD26_108992 [Aspergillus turcosus]